MAVCAVTIGIAIPLAGDYLRLGPINLAILVVAVIFLGVIALTFARSGNWRSILALSSVAFLGYPVGAIMVVLRWIPQFQLIPVFSSLQRNRSFLLLALLLGFTAYLFLLLGYRLQNKSLHINRLKAEETRTTIHYRRLLWVVAIYAVLGAVAIAYNYQGQGGLSYFITNVARLRTQAAGGFYLSVIAGLLPISCMLWLGFAPDRARRNWLFWGLVVLSALYSISLSAIWSILGFVLIMVLLLPPRQGGHLSRSNIALLVILTVVVVTLVVLILSWRSLSTDRIDITYETLTDRAVEMFSPKYVLWLTIGGRNATDVDLLAWIVRSYPPDAMLWGRSLLDIPLMVVPRALWPEKPTELGMRLFQEYSGWEGYPNAWHPGFVGELYVNFNLAGMVIGMLLLGVLCARLDAWGLARPEPSLQRILYAVIGIKFVVMGLVTGFMFPVIQTLMIVVPVYLASKWVTADQRASRQALGANQKVEAHSADRP